MERFTVSAGTNGCFSHRRQTACNSSIPISLPYNPHSLHPAASLLLPPENPLPPAGIGAPGLGVFKAERYFGGDEDGCYHCGSSRSAAISDRCDFSYPWDTSPTSFDGSYGRYCRHPSSRTVPTPSSEASWNSRSELLPRPSDPAPSKAWALSPRKPPSASAVRRWWLWLCCLCTGKGSIVVEKRRKERKTPIHSNYYSGSADGGGGRDARVLRKQGNGGLPCEFPAIPEATLMVEEMPPAKMQLVGKWPSKEEMEKEICPRPTPYSSKNHYPGGLGSKIVSSVAVSLHAAAAGGFSFPILTKPAAEDPHRESLEVFCPKEDATPMAAPTISEVPRRSFAFQTSSLKPPRQNDDVASDSSSDLFEIESFSTQTGAPCPKRDSLDAALGLAFAARRLSASRAKEAESEQEEETGRSSTATASDWCYPPSEVSVQWSVTTAEGFDQASVATYSSATSPCGDPWLAFRAEQDRIACAGTSRSKGSGQRKRRLSSGILGRRSGKAVGSELQSASHVSEKNRGRNAANASWNAATPGNWAGGIRGIGGQQFVSKPLQEPRLRRRNSSWIAQAIETR